MMDNIKINYWEVKGYRSNNDYDGPEDNNFCHVVAIDSRFTKDDVLDMMFAKFNKKYRVVVLGAKLVETKTIVTEAKWIEDIEYYSDDYSECNTRKVFRCSHCGYTTQYKIDKCFCGAKMTEEHKCKTLEEFAKVHCEMCGTQRCGGVNDEEMRDGCDYYRKEILGQQTLHELLEEISKQKHPATFEEDN